MMWMEEVKQEEVVEEEPEVIKQSKELKDTLQKLIDESRSILKEQRELASYNMMGGRTTNQKEAEKEKLTPKEYADRILKGKV